MALTSFLSSDVVSYFISVSTQLGFGIQAVLSRAVLDCKVIIQNINGIPYRKKNVTLSHQKESGLFLQYHFCVNEALTCIKRIEQLTCQSYTGILFGTAKTLIPILGRKKVFQPTCKIAIEL